MTVKKRKKEKTKNQITLNNNKQQRDEPIRFIRFIGLLLAVRILWPVSLMIPGSQCSL